jgi:hypothetical protein
MVAAALIAVLRFKAPILPLLCVFAAAGVALQMGGAA